MMLSGYFYLADKEVGIYLLHMGDRGLVNEISMHLTSLLHGRRVYHKLMRLSLWGFPINRSCKHTHLSWPKCMWG